MIDEKLQLLRRVPLFADLDADDLRDLAGIVDETEVPAGTALTHEGRHEGYFFVIVDGTVRIERHGNTVNTLSDGDFLGEIALLDGGPRTATAVTVTPCRLLTMTHPRFRQLLDVSSPIRTAVLGELSRRLRSLDAEAVY